MQAMTLDDWISAPQHYAKAKGRIYDVDGSFAKRGDVGEVCDVDYVDGYVIVDFAATGPVLCWPDEIRPQ